MNTAPEATQAARGWPSWVVWCASLFAVAIWPALGVAASHHLFDDPSEAALVFGGIISCLLYPIAVLVGPSDTAFMAAVMVLWVLLWLIPVFWLTRYPIGRVFQSLCIAILSAVSLAQATLGYLMILGKGV